LLTFESAYNALQHDAESVGELKETIKQQEEEVSDLKRQLQDKDDRIGVLESESVKLQQVAEKEKAARKEEVKQRERAETRLSDYLEEQQQMAKKYFTP
jgi:predicted RNase H-like nuclease (RuvC/YqgF family)